MFMPSILAAKALKGKFKKGSLGKRGSSSKKGKMTLAQILKKAKAKKSGLRGLSIKPGLTFASSKGTKAASKPSGSTAKRASSARAKARTTSARAGAQAKRGARAAAARRQRMSMGGTRAAAARRNARIRKARG